MESVQGTPRHQVLSTQEIYYPGGASWGVVGTASVSKAGSKEQQQIFFWLFCFFAGVGFKEERGSLC